MFKALKRMLRNSEATVEILSQAVTGIANQTNLLDRKLDGLIGGSSNQTDLLNQRLGELIRGSSNQTDLLNRKLDELIGGSSNQTDLLNRKLDGLIVGSGNQTDLLNQKLGELIGGSSNQTDLLNRKLDELVGGSSNQTDLLNRKLDELVGGSSNQANLLNQKLGELIGGSSNQSDLLNRKLGELIGCSSNQTDLLNRRLDELIAGIAHQTDLLNRKHDRLVEALERSSDLREVLERIKLLRNEPTETLGAIRPRAAEGERTPQDFPAEEQRTSAPRVSVLCVTYKQEKFVLEAIRGLLQQTVIPDDIIILDDASPDATAQIIAAELARYPHRADIRFIRNEHNLGVRGNILKGFSLAQGEFIILTCGDDIMLPTMVEKMVKVRTDERVSLVTANASYIDENSKELGRFFHQPGERYDDTLETLARDGSNALCHGASMGFDREVFDEAGWPRDYPTVLDIMLPFSASLAKGARFIPEPLLKYRVNSQNTSLSLAAESTHGINKLMIELDIFCGHIGLSLLMAAELDRMNEKDPERLAETTRRIKPLIALQTSEMAHKLTRTRIELSKFGVTRLDRRENTDN